MGKYYNLEVRIVENEDGKQKPVELQSGNVKDAIPIGSVKQGFELIELLGILYTTESDIRDTIPDYLKLLQKIRNSFD